ncbi:MAG: imidazolonepropionase [Candidatus Obscuribacterales bacterium]|jgi:imidazolonepropionase
MSKDKKKTGESKESAVTGPEKVQVDLLVHPIGELVTPIWSADEPVHGADMHTCVRRVRDAAIAVADGKVVAAGPAAAVLGAVHVDEKTLRVDAGDRLVVPGFVDPHTHLIFSGNRANEFIMRCQGKSYQEIAAAGGGIVASMTATRHATIEELVQSGLHRLAKMLAAGTTTCEVKTGYGLDEDSECRMLEAILTLRRMQPVELVPTFMPAHAFPPGIDREAYVDAIIRSMLPKAADMVKRLSGGTEAQSFNDVFCDEGYFTLAQTKAILEAGSNLGLRPKVHADEFANLGATRLAVDIQAASADHLLNVSDEEMRLLAKSNTVAVLLPGTSFFLNLKEHAPARKMIEQGVAVGLGSDFNPGSCHIFSLPLIFGLACLHLKMTAEEALTALTINAAHAVGLGRKVGQIAPNYQADIVVMDVKTLEEVPYNLGANPVEQVIKRGRIVAAGAR